MLQENTSAHLHAKHLTVVEVRQCSTATAFVQTAGAGAALSVGDDVLTALRLRGRPPCYVNMIWHMIVLWQHHMLPLMQPLHGSHM